MLFLPLPVILLLIIIPISSNGNEKNMLIFVQQWPITVCKVFKGKNQQKECTIPQDNNIWTIHGIWGFDSNCKNPPWIKSQIAPIRAQLEERWINVHGVNDHESFWRYEWNKHGTCISHLGISELSSLFDYFNTALQWNQIYKIHYMLKKHSIVPETDNLYDFKDVLKALTFEIGKTPQVTCNRNNLQEVRICFNAELKVENCLEPSKCPESVIYPATVY